jgi:hypothetical protein
MRPTALAALSLSLAIALAACAKPDGADADTPAASAATAGVDAAPAAPEAPAPPAAVDACALVDAAQMSAILGTTMKAAPSPPAAGKSECTYMPEQGVTPYAIVAVIPGDGEAAMTAMGIADDSEPGLASAYDGIGDQAFLVGEMLNIRSGADLVQVTLSGVQEHPAKAKAIFDAVKAKL